MAIDFVPTVDIDAFEFDSEMLEIKWPHLLCIAQELYSCNLKAKNKNETRSFLIMEHA